MQRRGLSDVVTTVLIILLVLGAVVLIWTFVRPLIMNLSEIESVEDYRSRLTIPTQSVIVGDPNVDFMIKRDAGDENISAFLVSVSDINGNSNSTRLEVNISALESKVLSVDYKVLGIDPVARIDAYPVFSSNGKERIGKFSVYAVLLSVPTSTSSCSTNAQCPPSQNSPSNYCSGNRLYNDITNYNCISGVCTASTSAVEIQVCSAGCVNGNTQCDPVPTCSVSDPLNSCGAPSYSSNYCDNNGDVSRNKTYSQNCVSGSCVSQTTNVVELVSDCSFGCNSATSTCVVSGQCGDGNLDSGLGEQCDDGNSVNDDGCSSTCQTENGYCSGSATISCSTYSTDQSSCQTYSGVYGCSWDASGYCTGTPNGFFSCPGYYDQSSCDSNGMNCLFDSENNICNYVGFSSCGEAPDQSGCQAVNGCNWETMNYCGGNINDCSSYSAPNYCNNLPGCSWIST